MRCFSVLGPPGGGKSALIDHLARLEGRPQSAVARSGFGVTAFRFMDEDWAAIDCPGAVESLPEARMALLASDMAVLVVPPEPEAAALAAPYLRAVEAAGAPCVIFVNRIDEARARMREVIAALQDYARSVIVLRQVPIREGDSIVGAVDLVSERAWRYRDGQSSALIEIPEDARPREHEARAEMLEHLSEFDDWLLEEIVEDREPAGGPLYAICTRVMRENAAMSALIGSAARSAGLRRLMKLLRHETPPPSALRARLAEGAPGLDAPPAAVAFQAQQRRHVGKTVLIRALDDGVAAGRPLGGGNVGGLAALGEDKRLEGALPVGGVAAAVKSDQLAAGRLLTRDAAAPPPAWARSPRPMVARLIEPAHDKDEAKLSTALARLAEDDPGLELEHEAGSGGLLARLQGPVHLRRLLETLREEFGVEARDAAPAGIYRESVTRPAEVHHRHRKQTGGAGQFADVKLTVRPNPRGAGFTFDEAVRGGAVPRNYIPAVETGARDAMERGPLGFPVADVGVTLSDGKAHSVDSSDFAFRTAGRAAVAQGLAEGQPVLLQPIFEVAIHAPSAHAGGLSPLVSSLKGRVLGFDRDPEARGWDLFRAQMPAATLEELAHGLRAATQGVGWFEVRFDHFEELYGREAEQVVAAQGAAPAPAHA